MDTILNFILNIPPTVIYAGLIGGLIGLAFSYKTLQEILRIRRMPISVISGLPSEGQVKVVGKAEGKIINSLLTQKSCVFWQVEIQEDQSLDDHEHWVTIHKDFSIERFELNDNTGTVHIYPEDAELKLRNQIMESSANLRSMNPQIIKDILRWRSARTARYKSFRIYERIIERGQELYIFGGIKNERGTKAIRADRTALIISDFDEKDALPGQLLIAVLFWGAILFSLGWIAVSFVRLVWLFE